MNEVVNNIYCQVKFMPEMHLKQRLFTYNACVLLTKNKERIQ